MDRDIASMATRRAALHNSIATYLAQGYRVVSQTDTTAQLVKPKQFSCLLAAIGAALFWTGFGLLFLVGYVIYYLASKDQQIYIMVDEYGTVSGTGGTAAIPRYQGPTAPPISRKIWGIALVVVGTLSLLLAIWAFSSRDPAGGVCFLLPAVGCLSGGIFLLVKKPAAKASGS